MNDYNISQDGTIFKIKEDGSIAKLAKIDNEGRIHSLTARHSAPNSTKSNENYWFFIILLAIAAIVLGYLYLQTKDNYEQVNIEKEHYKAKYDNESSSTSSLRSEISSLKSELSSFKNTVANTYPLIITDIKIGNVYYNGDVETNYGNSIYSSRTMYLKPQIKYTGLTSGFKTLYIKWFRPDGTMSSGSSSPYGYSQSDETYIYYGEDNTLTLSGWGNSTQGHWKSGTYRIEIWYGDACLKSKKFTIY